MQCSSSQMLSVHICAEWIAPAEKLTSWEDVKLDIRNDRYNQLPFAPSRFVPNPGCPSLGASYVAIFNRQDVTNTLGRWLPLVLGRNTAYRPIRHSSLSQPAFLGTARPLALRYQMGWVPPYQSLIKKMIHRLASKPVWWGHFHFLSCNSLFPDNSTLSQVQNKTPDKGSHFLPIFPVAVLKM